MTLVVRADYCAKSPHRSWSLREGLHYEGNWILDRRQGLVEGPTHLFVRFLAEGEGTACLVGDYY